MGTKLASLLGRGGCTVSSSTRQDHTSCSEAAQRAAGASPCPWKSPCMYLIFIVSYLLRYKLEGALPRRRPHHGLTVSEPNGDLMVELEQPPHSPKRTDA